MTQDWMLDRRPTGHRVCIKGTEEQAREDGTFIDPTDSGVTLRATAPCGNFYAVGPCPRPGHWQDLSPAFLADLPRDPAQLYERLQADAPDNARGSAELFRLRRGRAADRIGPRRPASWLYRTLARIDGIELTDEAANLDGRVGTAIGIDDGQYRHDIILTRSSHRKVNIPRPFAHIFWIWILLVAVVSARQSPLRGGLRGGGALLLSVVSFFYGKQIYYDILYPGPGFPYRVQPTELLFWGALGLVDGAVLGFVASRIGSVGWLSAAASALLMGLLLADAYHWYDTRGQDLPMAFALVGTVVIGALGHRSWRQIGYTAMLLIPGTVVGYFLISAPDWAQRLLRL